MVSEFDKTVAHSIRDLVTRMQRRMRKQVSNAEQMSVAELNVLQLLITGDELLPSELCAQLKISSQYMSQVLNRLVELGYISRKASQNDKRKSYVVMTEKGKVKIQISRQEREEWLAGLIAEHYTAKDKEIIQKAIGLLSILPDL
jgi:DNA-binding MarR family transcriptional regulator